MKFNKEDIPKQMEDRLVNHTYMDPKVLDEFMGKFAADAASAMNFLLIFAGDKLGLYKAMVEFGRPFTPSELSSKTGTNPSMIGEWLSAQAANGYVKYDSKNETFFFPMEHGFVLAQAPLFLTRAIAL